MRASSVFCATCGATNPPDALVCFACGNPPLSADPQRLASSSPTGLLAPQTLLKQRYRLLAQIGIGGFGAVYQAEDTALGNRKVAVKEMSQRGLTPEEVQEATHAFRNEALLLAGLTHPNLPRIYEQFEEGGRWYLVMDFIEGETLEEHLSNTPGGRLPVQEVLRIGVQLCAVLDYLHTRQPPIIFRDLKPANIMITQNGDLFLIDFGIARHFKPGQTRDTVAFGSAGYAAPEQYGKAQTTTQSDIYSLGATLHQLLSGNDPSNNPFLFAPLGQDEPDGLEALIMQMLEADATKRPRDIYTIGQKLQGIRDTVIARQKYTRASSDSYFPQIANTSKTSTMPSMGVAARPGIASPGMIAVPSSSQRGLSVKQKLGIASIGGAIAVSLVAAVIAWSLAFHQTIVTSQAVPYIQVGASADLAPDSSGSDSFHVGDTVYVTFILSNPPLPDILSGAGQSTVPVKLFLGATLKQSDTVSIGGGSNAVSFEFFSTPNGTVSGVQVTDSATVTQTGIYKWEIDDETGNAEASITFQVVS